jgi:hypothetical protein
MSMPRLALQLSIIAFVQVDRLLLGKQSEVMRCPNLIDMDKKLAVSLNKLHALRHAIVEVHVPP